MWPRWKEKRKRGDGDNTLRTIDVPLGPGLRIDGLEAQAGRPPSTGVSAGGAVNTELQSHGVNLVCKRFHPARESCRDQAPVARVAASRPDLTDHPSSIFTYSYPASYDLSAQPQKMMCGRITLSPSWMIICAAVRILFSSMFTSNAFHEFQPSAGAFPVRTWAEARSPVDKAGKRDRRNKGTERNAIVSLVKGEKLASDGLKQEDGNRGVRGSI